MNASTYRNRWFWRLRSYEKLGSTDNLITTSESDDASSLENNVIQIRSDIKENRIRTTEGGYSRHHFTIFRNLYNKEP